MSIDCDFFPLTELPSQRALLKALVPGLAALEQTSGVWLTGSLARCDADRWSSVDLHLQWDQKASDKAASSRPSGEILSAIEETLGEKNVFTEQTGEWENRGSLRGIAVGVTSEVYAPDQHSPAGVLFELSWVLSTDAKEMESPEGATRPLYLAEHLDNAHTGAITSNQAATGPPDIGLLERQLGRFWLVLARLPAAVGRQEQLAAHLLLGELHTILIDLVVSLNGGRRPQSISRVNQYLGPAQREAFERSLGLRQTGRQKLAGGSANWIGQAVALVVLYRWYAPQIVERYSLVYPRMAEDTTLGLLGVELENWPAYISTS